MRLKGRAGAGATAFLLTASALVLAQDAPLRAGSEGVPVPKRLKVVVPTYPPEAQLKGLRGIVILELTIDPKGKVVDAKVVRSVAPFDEAARTAALQWQYEPVSIDGRPVSVVLTVPITFALKLPEIDRSEGVPEMRQGAAPGIPEVPQPRVSTVKATVALDQTGYVVDAQVTAGEAPYDEALLLALRTWRFVVSPDAPAVAFDVEAMFPVPAPGATVSLKISNPRAAPEPMEPPDASPEPGAAPVAPEPSATPPVPAPASPEPASPAPSPAASPEIPAPAPSALPEPAPSPVAVPSAPPRRREVPTEVLTPTLPTPPPTPPPVPISSVRDVEVQAGLPDLAAGRRPVMPPIARIQRVSGTVRVRFAVDGSGSSQVQAIDGPEILQEAARQTVSSWTFRRQSLERLYMSAAFTYDGDNARAVVSPSVPFTPPAPEPSPGPTESPSPAPSPAPSASPTPQP